MCEQNYKATPNGTDAKDVVIYFVDIAGINKVTKQFMVKSINCAKSLLSKGYSVAELKAVVDHAVSKNGNIYSFGYINAIAQDVIEKIRAKEETASFLKEGRIELKSNEESKEETTAKQLDLVTNQGSERNIISICLKNTEKIIDVDNAEIFAEHFAVLGNRFIFMAMMYLYQKKVKPTALAIMEVLSSEKARSAVDELGGLEYISILEESTIAPESLNIFIEKVKQSFTRRSLLNMCEDIKDLVLSDKAEVMNPSELIASAETQINDISARNASTSDVYKMGDDTEHVLSERAKHPEQIPGIETGFVNFDSYTGGGSGGELIVVVAPSKTGKSITLTNWATKIGIKDKIPVLYFDTEMSAREQEDRILAMLTGIPQREIVTGQYVLDTANGKAVDKIQKIKKAREELGMSNYYHIYMPMFSIEKVSAIAKKFCTQMGVKAIFFDYIKIPSNQADFKTQQEYQALGFFTSGLKDLAGILNIPIFTACQTNRNDLKSENPDASDIGGSYRILQLASKLIFLINKSDERIAKEGIHNGNQQLIIKYQRNGESDCPPINIMFDRAICRQSEC